MNQLSDTDLKDAFTAFASQIPTEAGVRLRAAEYHPRTSRLSPRLTIGALGGAAATAGTVISVVVLGGATPAFAGWTAAPTAATPAQASSTSSDCQTQLDGLQGLPGSNTDQSWTPVVTDSRGPYTVVIYQDGSAEATCFNGPGFTTISQSSSVGNSMGASSSGSSSDGTPGVHGGARMSISTGEPLSGPITHVSAMHLDSTANGAYTLVEGALQSGVTAVTLDRTDGSDVQTTTDNGWFVAWWPGSAGVTSAQVTTASGSQTQNLPSQVSTTPPNIATPGGCGTASPPTSGGPVTCSSAGSSSPSLSSNG
jgi:hypothetical protein